MVVIRSFAGFAKLLLFLFTCVDVIPDRRVIERSKSDVSFVFITNNILVAIKYSTYLIDSADLDNETYEEW